MIFLFLNLGGGEILVIALFVLMFFGSKQIPELMRGLGRATREFKDAMGGIEREVRSATQVNVMDEEKKPAESHTDSKKISSPVPPEGTQQAAAMNQHVNDGPPVE
jgi:sec-independent protein translocase protein TatA